MEPSLRGVDSDANLILSAMTGTCMVPKRRRGKENSTIKSGKNFNLKQKSM
jgi:hypothetical protein